MFLKIGKFIKIRYKDHLDKEEREDDAGYVYMLSYEFEI